MHQSIRRSVLPMSVAWLVSIVAVVGPVGATVKELANDTFSGIGTVGCQTGFIEGEAAAAKLTADPGDYPYKIEKVRMLVCPGSTSGFVVLRISEDNSGTVQPGPVLYEEFVQVTGSNDALNELDLSASNLIIPSGAVRVELEWFQDGPPGVANDLDGVIPHVNYIYASLGPTLFQWFYAEDLGVPGDWIIRLEIDTGADPPIFADDFESGDTGAWSAVSP